ncbi:MAG TPA: hypothetical protein VHB79_08360 [Polyangiaceae bacterium]|nr:hypothetical protein [Polyangiaceae bacterium]
MNRSLLLTCLGLSALVAFGAFYGRLTEAAPASARTVTSPAPATSARAAGAEGGLATAAPAAPSTVVTASELSPEAERLEARRQLYESVDAFVQASEFEKARKLLDQDQARYGDDLAPPWHDLEQSYRMIADCLERPTPQLRVRARAFAQVSEAVSLKQRILKACAP